MGNRVAVARIVLPVLIASFCCVSTSAAREAKPQNSPAATNPSGVYLVFPFENDGSSPHLDWLGEGLEQLTISRLSAGGEQVYSRAGRIGELERYGLPASPKLSHATMLRMAQDLDADDVIIGSFHSDGTTLTMQARILVVNPAALLPEVKESGPLDSLMDLTTRLVWKLLSNRDRAHALTAADFAKRQRPLRLDAFEHYIRGLIAAEDEAKIRELKEAARLEPNWADPDYALGDAYFTRNDCDSALPWFARVPKGHDRYVEASFSSAVCRLQLAQPDRAEEAFRALQSSTQGSAISMEDSPELLNDLALAKARQGNLAGAASDLRRALEIGPDEDDYAFNLGLLALRANDLNGAANYFRDAIDREPDNPEDRALLIFVLEKAGKKDEAEEERSAAAEAFGPNGIPAVHIDAKSPESWSKLERLRTELDTAELRPELRVATSSADGATAASSANAHVRNGRQAMASKNLETATSEFQAALALNSRSAAAHRGLGEIARQQGRLDDAAKELQLSLKARDSASVRTALARIYLDQKKPEQARAEVERALKLAPNYAEAKQLLEHLQKPPDAKPDGGVR